jgi:Lon protease-like protein
MDIPLFPLHSILFPGGALPLRIFESRYIDMVRGCLRQDSGFGVCMIRQGKEVGGVAEVYEVGTYGRIQYFEQLDSGLLGITVRGERRFRVLNTWVEPNQLMMGEVEFLPPEARVPLTDQHRSLANLLSEIIQQLGPPYSVLPCEYDDASWVGQRLTELLPIDAELKQFFLQLDDPVERLERIVALLA